MYHGLPADVVRDAGPQIEPFVDAAETGDALQIEAASLPSVSGGAYNTGALSSPRPRVVIAALATVAIAAACIDVAFRDSSGSATPALSTSASFSGLAEAGNASQNLSLSALIAALAPGNSSQSLSPTYLSAASGSDESRNKSSAEECEDLIASDGMIRLVTERKNQDALYLDLTALFAQHHGRAKVLAMAMLARGTFTDTKGQVSTLHTLADQTHETLLELSLSADETSVDVARPQLALRTSDKQNRKALLLGAWGGWEGTSSRVFAACPKLGENRIMVDGRDFIEKGFFVEGWHRHVMSYQIRGVHAFPDNVDVTVEMIAKMDADDEQTAQQSIRQKPEALTVTFSLVRLPERPMPPRAMDDRIGYFTVDYVDLGERPNAEEPNLFGFPHEAVDTPVSVIQRYDLWALPNQQILVHVDPTVPKRWRQAFKEGIEAWNAAFDTLDLRRDGNKTIRAILPDDEDWPKDYHAGDARFNTISWSLDYGADPYSVGVSKVDPRSGQIIKSDIVMTTGWIRAWLSGLDHLTLNASYLSHGYRHERLASAVVDSSSSAPLGPLGKALPVDDRDDLLHAGLRSVVMHEMGHTLGLRHNFKGSAGITLECLRSASCTSTHGLTTSVMDYLPLNIVPDPASGGLLEGVHVFTPVVGAYDKLAIRYGYAEQSALENPTLSNFSTTFSRGLGDVDRYGNPFRPPEFLQPVLLQAEKVPFCSDGDWDLGTDPLCEKQDLSSSPLDIYMERMNRYASSLKAASAFPNTTAVAPGDSYTSFGEVVVDLMLAMDDIGRKLVHWIGGVQLSRVHRPGTAGTRPPSHVVQPIPVAQQRKALTLFMHILTPFDSALLPVEESLSFLVCKGGGSSGFLSVYSSASWDVREEWRRSQRKLLHRLMVSGRLGQVLNAERLGQGRAANQQSLTVAELLQSLTLAIWGGSSADSKSEGRALGAVASGQEDLNLQASYVEMLRSLSMAPPGDVPMEILAQVLQQALGLRKYIKRQIDELGDGGLGGLGVEASIAYLLHVLGRLPDPKKLAKGDD